MPTMMRCQIKYLTKRLERENLHLGWLRSKKQFKKSVAETRMIEWACDFLGMNTHVAYNRGVDESTLIVTEERKDGRKPAEGYNGIREASSVANREDENLHDGESETLEELEAEAKIHRSRFASRASVPVRQGSLPIQDSWLYEGMSEHGGKRRNNKGRRR